MIMGIASGLLLWELWDRQSWVFTRYRSLVTSILFNPFGGAIADRFSRRKVLMVTDLICAGLCLLISFISNDQLMIGALIFANVVQAIAFAFSRPANKSYITEIVDKEDINYEIGRASCRERV